MENKSKRVLAYQSATPLCPTEWDTVSGGQSYMTAHSTLRPSGGSIKDVDCICDYSIDW